MIGEHKEISGIPPPVRSRPAGWLSWAGLVTASFTTLCCIGVSAALSLATAVGATFLTRDSTLRPLLAASLTVTILGSTLTFWQRRRPGPLALTAGAAIWVYAFVCSQPTPTGRRTHEPTAIARSGRPKEDSMLARFRSALGDLLVAHGCDTSFIEQELEEMKHHVLDKTRNRSVVGVMNEFASLAGYHHASESAVDLKALAVQLAGTPCARSTRPTSGLTEPWRPLQGRVRMTSCAAARGNQAKKRSQTRSQQLISDSSTSSAGPSGTRRHPSPPPGHKTSCDQHL